MKIKIREFIKALKLLEDQIGADGLINLPQRSYCSDFYLLSEGNPEFTLRIEHTPEKHFIPNGMEDKKYKNKWELIPEKFEIKLTKTETKDVTNEKPVRFE